jgi:hypothetical protein
MVRILALVLLLSVPPALASVEFAARLEQARWTPGAVAGVCELIHRIPRYGVARFQVRGADAVKDSLLRRHAEAVRAFLEVYGIPRNRIEARSFGSRWPAVAGGDGSAWPRNRRATVWLAP